MTQTPPESLCPLCGGRKRAGKTTYTVELGAGVLVVRNVPATVCDQCGEEWIAAPTARELERLVDEARDRRQQVAVVAL